MMRHFICHFFIALILLHVAASQIFAATDEGRARKIQLWEQTSAAAATPAALPYRFIGNIRNTVPNATGVITLPPGALWLPNPVTIVTPSQLIGAHYQYEQSFPDLASLMMNFPDGAYRFGVTRTYGSTVTSFNAPVWFSATKSIPSTAPVVQNTSWLNGALILHPSDARLFYAKHDGADFGWEMTHANGSAGGSGNAGGMEDYKGILHFNRTYAVELRNVIYDEAIIVLDPNAGENSSHYSSTYTTSMESVVRLTLKTPAAPAGLVVHSATYTAGTQTWDVTTFIRSEINDGTNIVWRMEEGDLTNDEWPRIDGVLLVAYSNAEGSFSVQVPYSPDTGGNALVIPALNSESVPAKPSPSAALAAGIFTFRWPSVPGKSYQVQTSSNMVNWEDLGPPVKASTTTTGIIDTVNNSTTRFYQALPLLDPLTILIANFGAIGIYRDVRSDLTAAIRDGVISFFFVSDLNVDGDPLPFEPKTLYVRYQTPSGIYEVTLDEHDLLSIPNPNHTKL